MPAGSCHMRLPPGAGLLWIKIWREGLGPVSGVRRRVGAGIQAGRFSELAAAWGPDVGGAVGRDLVFPLGLDLPCMG